MPAPHVGGMAAAAPAAWVSGGRRLVVAFGRVLRVYEMGDGPAVALAALRGHDAPIVAVVAVAPMRVASASEDGTVRVWAVDDGALLRTIDVGQRLCDMVCAGGESVIVFGVSSALFVHTRRDRESKKKMARVFRNVNPTNVIPTKGPGGKIAASRDAGLVAAVSGKHVTVVAKDSRISVPITIAYGLELTAVAVSADGSLMAVGDSSGAIYVYRDVAELIASSGGRGRVLTRAQAPGSKLHWHSSSVMSLAFSEFGNILLSGGAEAVLVTWKMTLSEFGQRNFRPRLRGAIWGIAMSPDESVYALTHSDNSVRLLDPLSGNINTVLRGLAALLPGGAADVSAGKSMTITPEPGRTGCVFVAGSSDCVQVFDVFKGEHVTDMQVAARNAVLNGTQPHQKHGTAMPKPVYISMVRMSNDGNLMATVEIQDLSVERGGGGADDSSVSVLRFWERRGAKAMLKLVSRVDSPHGVYGPVSAMAFHPHLPLLATASLSGTFKLWRAVLPGAELEPKAWRCEATLSHRDLPCGGLAFSEDGSMLAVAAGSIVTLWHVEDCSANDEEAEHANRKQKSGKVADSSPCSVSVNFLHSLVHPPSDEAITAVSFTSDSSPLLVATTVSGVYVWHAITQGIWWSSRLHIQAGGLAVDPNSKRFALAVQIPAMSAVEAVPAIENDPGKSESAAPVSVFGHQGQGTDVADDKDPDAITAKSASATPSKKSKQSRKRPKPRNGLFPKTVAAGSGLDTGVILFDAGSPIPVEVKRLPVGTAVAAMSFVPSPGSAQGTPSPFVCLDTRMEMMSMGHAENEDVTSLVTQLSSEEEPAGKLDGLLGKNWRETSSHSASPHDESNTFLTSQSVSHDISDPRMTRVMAAFSKRFDGPVHAQAPVSSNACAFLSDLLSKSSSVSVDDVEDAKVHTMMDLDAQEKAKQPRVTFEKEGKLKTKAEGKKNSTNSVDFDSMVSLFANYKSGATKMETEAGA